MFPERLQILLLIISILMMFIIVNMIRKYSLELKYSLLWLGLGLLIIILVIFPNLLLWFSNLLGIELPSNALFLFGIAALFLIVFSLTVALSRSSNKVKELVQEIGLLKHQLEELSDHMHKCKQETE